MRRTRGEMYSPVKPKLQSFQDQGEKKRFEGSTRSSPRDFLFLCKKTIGRRRGRRWETKLPENGRSEALAPKMRACGRAGTDFPSSAWTLHPRRHNWQLIKYWEICRRLWEPENQAPAQNAGTGYYLGIIFSSTKTQLTIDNYRHSSQISRIKRKSQNDAGTDDLYLGKDCWYAGEYKINLETRRESRRGQAALGIAIP